MGQQGYNDPLKDASALRWINLGLHFLLELCAFTALTEWGFRSGEGVLMQIILAAVVLIVSAGIWGIFRIPGEPGPATMPVSRPVRLVIEWVTMGLAVVSVAAAGQTTLALIFAVVIVVDYIGLYAWRFFNGRKVSG